jgi:hyperosmotically inducible protein
VDTKNGTVWLSGDVKTTAERDRAIAKTKAIKGVKKVDASKLTVAGK